MPKSDGLTDRIKAALIKDPGASPSKIAKDFGVAASRVFSMKAYLIKQGRIPQVIIQKNDKAKKPAKVGNGKVRLTKSVAHLPESVFSSDSKFRMSVTIPVIGLEIGINAGTVKVGVLHLSQDGIRFQRAYMNDDSLSVLKPKEISWNQLQGLMDTGLFD